MDLSKRKNTNAAKSFSVTRLIVSFMVGVVVLLILVLSTTPDRIGPLGITVFFLVLLLTLINLGLIFRATFMPRAASSSLLLVIVTSLAITGALALNTIEIGLGEIVLLSLFTLTFGIYWTKLRR